jgi:NDP-sugar pyrophosphorylase family protein
LPIADVNALLLTAGLGTRLDPLSRLVAKAAVPLAGLTLAERALLWLHREGVRDVVLNLHHRPDTITRVVGDGAALGLRVRYSWEQPILGSAGGPRHALDLLDSDPILLANGDTLCDLPLAPMAEAHTRTGAAVTMALVPNPAPDRYNGVQLDDEDRIVGFVPAGQAQGTWHFIGIQLARRAVFAGLPDGVPAESVHGVYRDLLRTAPGSLRAWRVAQPFVDVGTPADYLRAALALGAAAPDASVIDADARVDESAVVRSSVVWPGARVGAGVRVERCIVAGPVSLSNGFRAEGAVIVPAAVRRESDRAAIQDDAAVFPLESR